jgi:hypothetical protein
MVFIPEGGRKKFFMAFRLPLGNVLQKTSASFLLAPWQFYRQVVAGEILVLYSTNFNGQGRTGTSPAVSNRLRTLVSDFAVGSCFCRVPFSGQVFSFPSPFDVWPFRPILPA